MITIEINQQKLLDQILKSHDLQKNAFKLVSEKTQQVKEELLQEFDSSPVTQEIKAGPSLTHSAVLPNGYGNLFGFLGFEEGSDPTIPLREELEKISVTSTKPEIINKRWRFNIFVPSTEDIDKVTPMQWETGRSWVNAVTKGLTGFSYYVNKLAQSIGRSGGGIQSKHQLRTGVYFAGTPYIIGMLGKLKRKLFK
jgi:hypothetical protein